MSDDDKLSFTQHLRKNGLIQNGEEEKDKIKVEIKKSTDKIKKESTNNEISKIETKLATVEKEKNSNSSLILIAIVILVLIIILLCLL